MKKGFLFSSVYITSLVLMNILTATEKDNDALTNTPVANTKGVDSFKCSRSCDSSCYKGFEIGADFLYWKPFFDNVSYAKSTPSVQITASPDSIIVAGTTYSNYVDNDWEPGVRVRLAKEDLWRGLDLSVNYVFIEGSSSAHTNLGKGPNAVLQNTTLPEVVPITDSSYKYSYLASKLKYKYQTFDVLFGTSCRFKNYYKLKPFVGVTGIFFKEKSETFGIGNIAAVGETSGTWAVKSDFTGVGLKLGTDFGWYFWDGLSLDGMGAAVVAAGSYDAAYPAKTKIPGAIYPNYNATFTDDFHISVTGYQIALGFRYEKCVGRCKFDLHLHYEMIAWHNLLNPTGREIIDHSGATTVYETQAGAIAMTFQGIAAGLDFHF